MCWIFGIWLIARALVWFVRVFVVLALGAALLGFLSLWVMWRLTVFPFRVGRSVYRKAHRAG